MADFPFDSIVFDLDGTLVATDRFWIPAARAGARRAFGELRIERELPSSDEWMSMVGYPLDEGFRRVFVDLDQAALARVLACVVEEEESALRAGGAALLPTVRETLETLAERGVRMTIASNCSGSYLETMMSDLGLARWIESGRCLDSARVHTKTDMVRDLLEMLGTRSAVMVGDRLGDCQAAHANGIPHVHVTHGFAARGERIPAEATIGELGELIPRLGEREAWIARALASVDLEPGSGGGPRTVGICGPPAAGKTLFARDASRLLRRGGRLVREVCVSTGSAPGDPLTSRPDSPPEKRPGPVTLHAADVHDAAAFEELVAGVLDPFASGRAGRHGAQPGRNENGPEVLLVEGAYLLHPRIASHLDRLIYLDVPLEVARRRHAGRIHDATPRALELWREGAWAEAQALGSRYLPQGADIVLQAENPLGEPGGA